VQIIEAALGMAMKISAARSKEMKWHQCRNSESEEKPENQSMASKMKAMKISAA
jgi:hypothetical protein